MAKANKASNNESDAGKYKCLVKIKFNGKAYKAGDAIQLSDKEAQQLLIAKAIEPDNSPAGVDE